MKLKKISIILSAACLIAFIQMKTVIMAKKLMICKILKYLFINKKSLIVQDKRKVKK
jgi:hypothetical protein